MRNPRDLDETHLAASSRSRRLPSASASSPTAARRRSKEIRIDCATYNPVSLVLKEKGFLEKELAKDGITVRWVQSLGSNKALEFLNAGSLDFGSTAGAAALHRQDQRQPDQIHLRLFAARMDGAGHPQGHRHHQGRGPEGQARRGHPRHRSAHLPGARARRRPGSPRRTSSSSCCSTRTAALALERGDVDAWAGLDPMMAAAEVESGADAVLPQCRRQHLGLLNVREAFAKEQPGARQARAQGLRGGPRLSLANPDELKQISRRLHQAARAGHRPPARAHRAHPFDTSASRRRTRSSPPASRCSRPASSSPTST